MTDLISRLRHEAMHTGYKPTKPWDLLVEAADEIEHQQNNIDNMRDEIERLRADAERYRWLRANMTGVIQLMGRPGIGLSGMTGNDFDDAIDAALKEPT